MLKELSIIADRSQASHSCRLFIYRYGLVDARGRSVRFPGFGRSTSRQFSPKLLQVLSKRPHFNPYSLLTSRSMDYKWFRRTEFLKVCQSRTQSTRQSVWSRRRCRSSRLLRWDFKEIEFWIKDEFDRNCWQYSVHSPDTLYISQRSGRL